MTTTTHKLELEKIGGSKPWVARITGTDPKYGQRTTGRLTGITRGVYTHYHLTDGLYQINKPCPPPHIECYFAVVQDGELREVTEDEATDLAVAMDKVHGTGRYSPIHVLATIELPHNEGRGELYLHEGAICCRRVSDGKRWCEVREDTYTETPQDYIAGAWWRAADDLRRVDDTGLSANATDEE